MKKHGWKLVLLSILACALWAVNAILIVEKLTLSTSVTPPIVQDDTDNGTTDEDESGEGDTTPNTPSNPDNGDNTGGEGAPSNPDGGDNTGGEGGNTPSNPDAGDNTGNEGGNTPSNPDGGNGDTDNDGKPSGGVGFDKDELPEIPLN